MKQSVSFLKLKLTNNTLDQHGHVSGFFECFTRADGSKNDTLVLQRFRTTKRVQVAFKETCRAGFTEPTLKLEIMFTERLC